MKSYILAPALIALSMTSAVAQDRQAPPKMPIAEMAAALGVSEDAAQDCLMPKKMGEQSTGQKGPKGPPSAAETAEILNCLQASNSSLTAEIFHSVMQTYGPQHGGRK